MVENADAMGIGTIAHTMEIGNVVNATKMFIDIVHNHLRDELRIHYMDQQAKRNCVDNPTE
jgi:hypothetical protein